MDTVLCLHTGLGRLSSSAQTKHRRLIRRVLTECRYLLESQAASIDAIALAVHAVRLLESDPLTNAGYGSALNENGQVECDATVMDGLSGQFGSVGAVTGLEHPVDVAEAVCRQAMRMDEPSSPHILVAEGAQAFALRSNIPLAPFSLISPAALLCAQQQRTALLTEAPAIQDTVGCIVWHGENMAAAVSSGGPWNRPAGRIGPAAVAAAGCWIRQNRWGTVTTGDGEALLSQSTAMIVSLTEGGGEAEEEENEKDSLTSKRRNSLAWMQLDGPSARLYCQASYYPQPSASSAPGDSPLPLQWCIGATRWTARPKSDGQTTLEDEASSTFTKVLHCPPGTSFQYYERLR
jgi:isoaspartyl peptidase/L-asparaginase-like protein (Ntn-hydrolase superfamily)